MRRWAAVLIVMGLGSFVLPLVGMQFRLLNFIDEDAQPVVGLVMAAVAGLMLLADRFRDRWPTRGAARPGTAGAPAPAPAQGHAPAPAPAPAQGHAPAPAPTPPARPASAAAARGDFCPECGQRVGAEAAFCGHCGHALAHGGAPASTIEASARTASVAGARDDRPRLNRIAAAYQRGELAPARTQLLGYLQDHPQDPTAWSVLCNVEEALGDRQQAEQAARRSIAIDPDCVSAHNNLGRLCRERRDYAAATASYQRAIAIEPGNAHAHSGLAVVEMSQGHAAQAVALARRAYELDAQDAVVASNLAVAYHCAGQVADRDRMKAVCQRLGYPNVAGLERIFRGEVPVVDPPVPAGSERPR